MQYIGYIYAVGAAVTWGLVYALDQKILERTTPLALIFFQAVISVLILLPIIIIQPGPVTDYLKNIRSSYTLIFVSLVLTLMANFLIVASVGQLGANRAAILEISYPIFTVIFTFLLFKNAITLPFFIGGLLIFLGTAIVIKYS